MRLPAAATLAAALLGGPPARAQQDDLLPRPAIVVELPAEKPSTRFRTRRFEIVSDAPLQHDLVERFSQVVDTVPLAISRLPLPLLVPPTGAPPRIELLSSDDDYERAGAPAGTAGFYDGRKSRLLVRRKFLLNPPRGATARLAAAPDQDLLVHELGHLCMHGFLGRTPQWFAEGACEYLACLHHADGRFTFRNPDILIRDHLRSRFDPQNPAIELTRPTHLAGLSGREWSELTGRMPAADRYRNYATALLLFHYHLHGGPERREALRKRLESALARRRPPPRWLDPQDLPALEKSLTRYWKPRGLQLRFVDP